jgi:predicted translin family RNA/ssDNA-binding protein
MKTEKIRELVEELKERAEAREKEITAGRKASKQSDAIVAAETVHQAHINELEYVIDELQQLLLEDDDEVD